jgi:hypothetical protein
MDRATGRKRMIETYIENLESHSLPKQNNKKSSLNSMAYQKKPKK